MLESMKQHNEAFDAPNPRPTSADHQLPSTPLYAVPDPTTAPAIRRDMPESAATRVQVKTPEDLLAYIQCTLGFRPTNSLVVVAFSQRQLSTVVRCDLPDTLQNMLRSDTPDGVSFLDCGLTESQELQFIHTGRQLGQLMVNEPSTTSLMLIYLAENVNISDQQALAVAGTANAIITAQFGVQGARVEESWFIHRAQMWHLRCASTTQCTVQGVTIGDPCTTQVFSQLDPHRRTVNQVSPINRRLIFPPQSRTQLHTQTASTQRTASDVTLHLHPQLVMHWLRHWDEHLTDGPKMLHARHVADLLESLEEPKVRDAILGLACFDMDTTIRGMVALEQFPTEVATLTGLVSNLVDGWMVKDCLKGQSVRSPDWERIGQLERLCHRLLPLSDADSGGVVAGVLVWIEWVRGRGSLALSYVRQARHRFPTEQFLMTLEGLLRQGIVAEWATRVDSAWSPQHAA